MRRIAIVLGAAALCGPAGAQQTSEPTIVNPDWIRKPTYDEMMAVLPYEATAAGRNGSATIDCRVSSAGALSACTVTSEQPQGYGFGQAALALAQAFRMSPAMKDGKPVESQVSIPIIWKTGGNYPQGEKILLLSRVPWIEAPTAAEMAQAYPAGVRGQISHIVLRCTPNSDGRLKHCEAVTRDPRSFVKAAKSLVGKFRVDPGRLEGAKGKIVIDVPFHFVDPQSEAWTGRKLGKANWVRSPTPEAARTYFPAEARSQGARSGRGVVHCAIASGGALGNCTVRSEEPAGQGFGPAAVRLASLFVMNPWTEEGMPAEGITVDLPLRLNDEPQPAATAPTTP